MRHLIVPLLFLTTTAYAQNVGINPTGGAPDGSAMLDVSATDKGMLVPRLALTALNAPAPVAAPIASLLVYNTATAGVAPNNVTPGYYYWSGAPANQWIRFAGDGDAWRTAGNTGTVATTNFLGTTDAVALRIRTENFERFEINQGTGGAAGTGGRLRAFQDGTAALPIYSWNVNTGMGMFRQAANVLGFSTTGVERLRVLANGQVVVPGAAAIDPGDLLTGIGSAAFPFAVNGYGAANGAGVFGQGAATSIAGVWGVIGSPTGYPVFGWNVAAAGTGTGVIGLGNNLLAPTILAAGGGGAFTGTAIGAYGRGTTVASGTGAVAAGNNLVGITLGGGSGGSFLGTLFGAYAHANTVANGTGVVGTGNNVLVNTLAAGSGGAFFGNTTGAYGRAYTAASGTGVVGAGNNLAPFTLGGGGGGAFTGSTFGAYGHGATVVDGTGVVGVGNNVAVNTLPTGSGGAFFGNTTGAYGRAYTAASGTGVVGAGNNLTPTVLAAGSGGAFTGTTAGAFGIGTTVASGTGVIGAGNNLAPVTLGGGSGGAFTGATTGAFGIGTTAGTGVGVVGTGNNLVAIIPGNGAGGAFTGDPQGVYARGMTAATGLGIMASGNGIVPTTVPDGGGGSFRGTLLGAIGSSVTAADGTGLVGLGNNEGTYYTLDDGSGVAGTGTYFGVYGVATSAAPGAVGAPTRAGGYFVSGIGTGATETWTYVAAFEGGGVPRKVMGDGTVNTVVRDMNDDYVLLSAPEAPENLFQDYGTGQLVNGRAHIVLDPILSKNILVNQQHPLRVFVQLRGDCNGVYVTNESATGFEVVELMGGSSNASFYWSVTANRANTSSPSGVPWNYAEERFARTQGPQHTRARSTIPVGGSDLQPTTTAPVPMVSTSLGSVPMESISLGSVPVPAVLLEEQQTDLKTETGSDRSKRLRERSERQSGQQAGDRP